MADKYLKKTHYLADYAGVIACAGTLALMQWFLNKDSVEQPETQNLIRFMLIDSACFSVSLLIVGKLWGDRLGRYLLLLTAALLGALASTDFVDLPFLYQDIQNWSSITQGLHLKALFIVLWNSFVAVLTMILICGIGVITGVDRN
jgi:hypothetical protein